MMKIQQFARLAATAILVAGLGYGVSNAADEVTDAHLKAARAALVATGATNPFDGILPGLSGQLKQTLIQSSPNYEAIINATVDETALKLAPRRGDLEQEAARVFAKAFTEAELKEMTAFFTSPTGLKFLKDGPLATRELGKAADTWGTGISRDLAKETDTLLEARIKEMKKSETTPQ